VGRTSFHFDVTLHNLRGSGALKLILILCRFKYQFRDLASKCNNYSFDEEIDFLNIFLDFIAIIKSLSVRLHFK